MKHACGLTRSPCEAYPHTSAPTEPEHLRVGGAVRTLLLEHHLLVRILRDVDLPLHEADEEALERRELVEVRVRVAEAEPLVGDEEDLPLLVRRVPPRFWREATTLTTETEDNANSDADLQRCSTRYRKTHIGNHYGDG